METKERLRWFLKDSVRRLVDFSKTPQNLGYPPPPLQKPVSDGDKIVALPERGRCPTAASLPVGEAMERRCSRRKYSQAALSLEELSFLLWATQGIRGAADPVRTYRTVPSAGCRHPLETYLAVFRVQGLETGVYRYLPLQHSLVEVARRDDLETAMIRAANNQPFAGKGAVTFIWSAVPERTEWRYAEASVKVIALDAGHVCQNLYLACEAIGAGTCAIAAYDQELADGIISVDGTEEFAVYMAPVGKV